VSNNSADCSLPAQRTIYRCGGKRVLDIVLATAGIVVLSPFIVLCAVAVILESGWPFVFKQVRCGLHGNTFTIYKIRTMSVARKTTTSGFEAGSGVRVTKVGRFLRKTKLDETLQLFNVLKGDMAIIGPRPEVPHWVSQFPVQWAIAHTVRPGLSDEAALLYRHEEEELSSAKDADLLYKTVILPRKLALYSDYVAAHSLQHDIFLIFRTIKAVFC
jgi:lipopolysaccharide/colanic/teichoic acid biosynthesis glycosyltransferase